MELIDRLFETLEVDGGARYGMEAINQLVSCQPSLLLVLGYR